MPIVFCVATDAAAREFNAIRHGRAVALLAGEVDVRPVQLERGLGIVVEAPALPAVRVVAVLAARAEAPEMHVLDGVTREAIAWCVLEARRRVALLASGDRVDSEERESADVVLEEDLVRPGSLIVAILAARPLLSRVDVVELVTGDAGGPEHSLAHRACMAALALHLGMRPLKRKVGHLVVFECFGRPVEFSVTSITARAVARAVHVVGAMARETIT
jgi:hypothetical protein